MAWNCKIIYYLIFVVIHNKICLHGIFMLLEKKKLLVTTQFKIQEEILWIKFAENIERSKGLTMKSALNKRKNSTPTVRARNRKIPRLFSYMSQ